MENKACKKFTNNFFSIKRSDKYFCGTWSDMVIEQSLMKSSKSKEGFTRGRSTKESVLSKWIFGLLTAIIIRLGGFHLLMSFLGSIGYIIYASQKNAFEKKFL